MNNGKSAVEHSPKEKIEISQEKESNVIAEKLQAEIDSTIPKYGPDGRLASTKILRPDGYEEISFTYHPDGRKKSITTVEVKGNTSTKNLEEFSAKGELTRSESSKSDGKNWSRHTLKFEGALRIEENESISNGKRSFGALAFDQKTGEWTETIDRPDFKSVTTGDAQPGEYLTQQDRKISVERSQTTEFLSGGRKQESKFVYNGHGEISRSSSETFDAAGNKRDEDYEIHFGNIFDGIFVDRSVSKGWMLR